MKYQVILTSIFILQEPGADSIRNKDGVLVDEFGLPQIPTTAKTT